MAEERRRREDALRREKERIEREVSWTLCDAADKTCCAVDQP